MCGEFELVVINCFVFFSEVRKLDRLYLSLSRFFF